MACHCSPRRASPSTQPHQLEPSDSTVLNDAVSGTANGGIPRSSSTSCGEAQNLSVQLKLLDFQLMIQESALRMNEWMTFCHLLQSNASKKHKSSLRGLHVFCSFCPVHRIFPPDPPGSSSSTRMFITNWYTQVSRTPLLPVPYSYSTVCFGLTL